MWECQKCGEKLEGSFDACWNCGAPRTDEASPESRVESAGEMPEHQPPLEEFFPTSKSIVASLLAIVVGVCGIAALV